MKKTSLEIVMAAWAGVIIFGTIFAFGRWLTTLQPKPALVNQAWGWVQGCTSVVAERGKNPNGALGNVVWRTFPDGTIAEYEDSVPHPETVIGLTVRTPGWSVDTIFIDATHQDTVWVLAHELLHHYLADEDVWGSAHPFVPFAFPCQLMEWQRNGIGIMGQKHERARRTP